MKTLLQFSIILLLFVTFSCSGTQHKKEKSNYQKVAALIQSASDSIASNNSFAQKQVDTALSIVKDSLQYLELLNVKNSCYIEVHAYDSAYPNIKKLLNKCRKFPRSKALYNIMASANNTMGGYYGRTGQMDSSLLYFTEAYNLNLLGTRNEVLPNICINLASAYLNKSDFVKSAYFYRKALYFSDSLNLSADLGFAINYGLGQVYSQLRDFELSDSYFRTAEKTMENGSLEDKFFFSNSRGNYYYFREQYAQALEWFRKALAMVSHTPYEYSINLCELNMSDIFLHLNRLDSAKYYSDRAYLYFTKINHATALYYLSTIRAGIALKQNNPALAYERFRSHQDTTGIEIDMIAIRNKLLQDYYVKVGNYKNAYHYLLRNRNLTDSIQSERVRGRIAELDMRYKQDTVVFKRDLIISAQQSKMQNLRMTTYIWLLVSFIVLAGALLIFFNMKKQRNLLQLQHFGQVTKLRMQNIRNRVSPHFIFNVLNLEANSSENQKGQNRLGELVKLMRSSLELSEGISTTLHHELDFVKTYIELEKGSLGNDFELQWEITQGIEYDTFRIPAMIIQIPVENAIKHALRGKMGEKTLKISVNKEINAVKILIQDNGPGYNPGMSYHKGTGTGLKVIYQTIELLNEKNPAKLTFSISTIKEEGSTGTKVEIHVPEAYLFEL